MKHDVVTLANEPAGSIDLADEVFGVAVRPDIIQRMVRYQLAKRHTNTHKTKEIGEVSGTTAKPFKQKGTGRARQGSRRSPQFRGGATIFGPVVRSHEHDLPKKVRKLALKSALASKLAEGKLVVIDSASVEGGKTSTLAKQLKALDWQSVLFIAGTEPDTGFCRAARNIAMVDVLPQQGANVYDIMRRDRVVLTRDAVEQLEARLK